MADEWGYSYPSPGMWGKPYSPSADSISLLLAANDPINSMTGFNFTGRVTPDILNTVRRSRSRSAGNANSPSQFSFGNFLTMSPSQLNSFRPLSGGIGTQSRSPHLFNGFRPPSAASHVHSRSPLAVPNFRTPPLPVCQAIEAPAPQRSQASARGPRVNASQWDSHKAKIKELFIDEDKSLEETMRIMDNEFSFAPTKKQYNNKLKRWGFIKNISGTTANWILNKAKTRKREEGKDTEFSVGDQPWTMDKIEQSAKRAKIDGKEAAILDPSTPLHVHYGTPGMEPPASAAPVKANFSQAGKWNPFASSDAIAPAYLRLQWNGKNKAGLERDHTTAQRLSSIGQIQEAEDTYLQALGGFQALLGPTHTETNAIAYELAEFYAQNDRMEEADRVLDWMGEKHLERWGINHKNVRGHLIKVAEMLGSWSREEDAILMISRAADCYEQSVMLPQSNLPVTGLLQNRQIHSVREGFRLAPIIRSPEDDEDEVRMDYQLRLAITHANAEDMVAEKMLLTLCEQCERHPVKLAMQIIEARVGLIEFYKNLELSAKFDVALGQIGVSFWKVFESDVKRTELLLNAAIELISWLIKAGRHVEAEPLLQQIQTNAVETFGEDDEVTISILIRIGILFQEQDRWVDARPRFEQALAASMIQFGLACTMTTRLEEALYQKSYDASSPDSERIRRQGHNHRWNSKVLRQGAGSGRSGAIAKLLTHAV